MNKDLPSSLFETLVSKETSNAAAQSTDSRDSYAEKENLTNLNYTYPIAISFDESSKQPRVLTQMIYADDRLKQTTPLLPWNLPNDLKKSGTYNIYHEINEKLAQQNQSEYYYLATCKSTRAKFFPSLLKKSINHFFLEFSEFCRL